MNKSIYLRPRASQDIDDHVAYIAENNVDVALKFFDSIRQTIAQLARMPGMGSFYRSRNPQLKGLQKWAVKSFKTDSTTFGANRYKGKNAARYC